MVALTQTYHVSRATQRALIDAAHAALDSQFAPARCILPWNAAPYYVPGFQLVARRDGRVIVRHVLADMRTRAKKRTGIITMLERYQRVLIDGGVQVQLVDERGKAPHLVCCVSKAIMSIKDTVCAET